MAVSNILGGVFVSERKEAGAPSTGAGPRSTNLAMGGPPRVGGMGEQNPPTPDQPATVVPLAAAGHGLEFWKHAAQVLAAVTACVSLFGFGVVLGTADAIGLDQGTVISGPFDLLTLVWPGVLMILDKFGQLDWAPIFKQLGFEVQVVFAIVFVATLLFPWPKRLSAVARKSRSFIAARLQTPTDGKSFWQRLWTAAFVAPVAAAGSASAILMAVLVVYSAIIILCTLPFMGFGAGSNYVQKFVITPKHCTPMLNWNAQAARRASAAASAAPNAEAASRSARASKSPAPPDAVRCVAAVSVDPTKPFLRTGRSVLSSSTLLLVWDPDTGEGHRVPIAAMEVSAVDEAGIERMKRAFAVGTSPSSAASGANRN